MKRALLIIVLTGVIFLAYRVMVKARLTDEAPRKKSLEVSTIIPTEPVMSDREERTFLFVPYWSIKPNNSELLEYDRLFYFGISYDRFGIDETDEGYRSMKLFSDSTHEVKDRILTVRMLDMDVNTDILRHPEEWSEYFKETVELAKLYGFNGVALDLEMSGIPFERTVNAIVDFNKGFYEFAVKNELHYSLIMYGDVMYRPRPFYMPLLSKSADEIVIMAYDYHKASGEPGPNFPLKGREKYGYDMKQMIEDFNRNAPADKLTVVFGMYGYDWVVDIHKKPVKPAKSISISQIESQILSDCSANNCVILKDKESGETEVNYVDQYTNSHIVWFEDMESVKRKSRFLKGLGINSFGFWAYGYF